MLTSCWMLSVTYCRHSRAPANAPVQTARIKHWTLIHHHYRCYVIIKRHLLPPITPSYLFIIPLLRFQYGVCVILCRLLKVQTLHEMYHTAFSWIKPPLPSFTYSFTFRVPPPQFPTASLAMALYVLFCRRHDGPFASRYIYIYIYTFSF
jgi:hypothetical protein